MRIILADKLNRKKGAEIEQQEKLKRKLRKELEQELLPLFKLLTESANNTSLIEVAWKIYYEILKLGKVDSIDLSELLLDLQAFMPAQLTPNLKHSNKLSSRAKMAKEKESAGKANLGILFHDFLSELRNQLIMNAKKLCPVNLSERLPEKPSPQTFLIAQQLDEIHFGTTHDNHSNIEFDREIIKNDSHIYGKSVYANYIEGEVQDESNLSQPKIIIGYTYAALPFQIIANGSRGDDMPKLSHS